MSAQQRDRTMQVYLAQARGAARNGDMLRAATDRMLRMRAVGKVGGTVNDALVEMLDATVEALEAVGAIYAVTGSIASSVHSEPLMSEDVDLLVVASPDAAARLAGLLTPRFYAPQDMLRDAAKGKSFANVVDNRTGLKVDLSFVANKGFLHQALQRRVRMPIGTASATYWFVTAEDVILMKLIWRKDTRSQKQWDNALGVAKVKGARMDWKYLFEQAGQLGVEEDLIRLRDEAGI